MENNKEKKAMDRLSIGSADFEITETHIIVYNVPITGEIVQQYEDGVAYKPLDEIKKIEVDNFPITFLHPDVLISEMSTSEFAKTAVGTLKKPSLSRKNPETIDSTKKYADFVVGRSSQTIHFETALKQGRGVDVSIGFRYTEEETSGVFKNQSYDCIQTQFKMDHAAILMDDEGRVYRGRAPFPKYGIGADMDDGKMSDNKIEELTQENKDLKAKVDSLEGQLASKTAMDADVKSATDKAEKMEKRATDAEEKLAVFEEKEKAAVDQKRKELSEKYPAVASAFDSADAESINKSYEQMKEKQAKDIDGEKKKKAATDSAEDILLKQMGQKEDE